MNSSLKVKCNIKKESVNPYLEVRLVTSNDPADQALASLMEESVCTYRKLLISDWSINTGQLERVYNISALTPDKFDSISSLFNRQYYASKVIKEKSNSFEEAYITIPISFKIPIGFYQTTNEGIGLKTVNIHSYNWIYNPETNEMKEYALVSLYSNDGGTNSFAELKDGEFFEKIKGNLISQ